MEWPKYERILAPTDFSPFSRRAFDYALMIAKLYAGAIDAVYVQPLLQSLSAYLPYLPAGTPLDEDMRKNLFRDLRLFVEPAEEARVPAEFALLEGDPADRILARAATTRPSLIVMGTHGLRGFDRWLMGSVSERVIRKAACPVLTVGEGHGPGSGPPAMTTILCALDLSGHSDATLMHALSLARASNASLLVVHVVERDGLCDEREAEASGLPFVVDFRRHVEDRARTKFEALVPEAIGDVFGIERILLFGTPHEQILRVARQRHPSLVVLGIRGARAAGFAMGSTAQHVVREMDCPVLTVRPS
jgi:nucleotide-binding universal stress UspA family protein